MSESHSYNAARTYIGGHLDEAGRLKPTVQVPQRVAIFLYQHAGLIQLRDKHIADRELHAVLTAFGILSQSSSDAGTIQAKPSEPMSESKQLTTAQAATRAKVTPRAIVKAINEHRLPATKTGTTWTVTPQDLNNYLKTRN